MSGSLVYSPEICARPVRPGRAAFRSPYPGTVFAKRPANSGRSGRGPDEAHVAAQHVPELRDLVDAGAPQRAADRRHPRIVGRREHGARLDLGALAHRAQLPELEEPPVAADARLAIEDAPRRRDADERRREQQPRREQHERDGGHDGVEGRA